MIQLLKYEGAKIIKNRNVIGGMIAAVLMMLGVFLVGYYYSQTLSAERHRLEDGITLDVDQKIQADYAGTLSDQKVAEIVADYMNFFQDSKEASEEPVAYIPFYYDLTATFVAKDRDVWLDMAEAVEQGKRVTIKDIKLNKVADLGVSPFSEPLRFGNYVPWKDLFAVTSQLFLVAAVLSIFICSLVFADDVSRNINQLLLTTKYGRNKMIAAKIIMATLISLLCFAVIELINFGVFSWLYDTRGWDTHLQMNFNLQLFDFPLALTHGQIYLLLLLIYVFDLLFVIGVSLLISANMSAPFSALAIGLGVFFLPQLLLQLFTSGWPNTMLYLFPINHPYQTLLAMLGYDGQFILKENVHNFFLLLAVLLAGKILTDCGSYYRAKRWQLR